MPFPSLTQDQTWAFIAEMTSARNLLGYGEKMVRATRYSDATLDPVLTVLSIGTEKLYKLVIGLMAIDGNGSWPTKSEMRDRAHGVEHMHHEVFDSLRVRVSTSSDYVRGLVAIVDNDAVVPPLIACLDMYGRQGRFHYLDTLAEDPPKWAGPESYWRDIEKAAQNEPEVASLFPSHTNDQAAWDAYLLALRGRIADSARGIWLTVTACGRNGVLGELGRTFGFEAHPNMVGTQQV